jgi:hypothetical protein
MCTEPQERTVVYTELAKAYLNFIKYFESIKKIGIIHCLHSTAKL